jgi:hypothetical protein
MKKKKWQEKQRLLNRTPEAKLAEEQPQMLLKT